MKFKKASIFTTLVIAVLMVYALFSLFVLQYQIDHSEDDDMIESVAREKLGLVKPGEKIFYDTSD